ncbi:MAG: tRNA (guanosine(37)-N1)-methyltransferase TrmD [Oscillospiraceae bacterium]|nr:tRNA (guanosine(37)-N1)-methyltransferase TrmD [Oscillospiraceae bacterium]
MIIEIATLFPEMCEAVLSASILGRARAKGAIEVNCHQIRDYTTDRHNRVDDSPFGGGMGMVMQAQPVYDCWRAVQERSAVPMHTIYMSPKGHTLTQQRVRELAQMPRLFLLCGHYEGIDQRVLDRICDEEISIGDYVVTGGELPALVLTDAIARMCENVLPSSEAYEEESHFNGLLEYPQYTRPEIWEGEAVPPVLLSGHHKNIAQWRAEQSRLLTRERRPDLYAKWSKEQETNGLL